MKKKNLIILLLIPFMIALLGVVTLNTTFHIIDNDIVAIEWDYDDVEAFKLSNSLIPLNATGVNQKNYPAGAGNALTWTITNENETDTNVYAEIIKQGTQFYLKTLKSGRFNVTCSNEKGNVFKTMNVIIYETGAIIIKPLISASGTNIDPNIYYGEYDIQNGKKVNANISFSISAVSEMMNTELQIDSITDNISLDLKTGIVNVLEDGPASFTISCGDEGMATPSTYKFNIVDNGVNVYSYDDLLYCSNKSTNGEIIVLRKSFESLDNAYLLDTSGNLILSNNKPVLKANNIECFGNYNVNSKTFNFAKELYAFTTTYNKEFIEQWNDYMKEQGSTNFISDQVKVGLRIQKDFYGNGYTINMHNLTFPTSITEITDDAGNILQIPTLSNNDLFRGPLPYYTLGDHNNMPLVEAFGQDNVGMYVNGNDITINDVNVKNCDFGNMLANLDTVGTVMDVYGNNITILNSRLSNGKNVLRCFSSNNVLVKNSMLSNSRNFLLTVGSGEFIDIDELEMHEFINLDGTVTKSKIIDFMGPGKQGDLILNDFLMANFTSKENMRKSLLSMQKAFNNEEKIKDIYKGSITVEDVYFYQSGISSIALETMFNGPFLNSPIPSTIKTVLGMLQTQDGVPLGNFIPTEIAGVSYPVEVNICGDTRFYDYKNINAVDITGLIKENISSFAASVDPSFKGEINIDKIFPIKTYLINSARSKGYLYKNSDIEYINIPIAYYGGGLNLSKVTVDETVMGNNLGEKITIDFLESYLNLGQGSNTIEMIKNMMLKAVTIVTGYEPFYFECINGNGYLFGETPKVADLIQNAKGGKSDEKN